MREITLAEAAADLAHVVEMVSQGEEIVLVKDNQTAVKLSPIEPKRYPAKAGSAKGLVWMSDDFDEPLEDFKQYME
jgi:antitoxin (DNA-binding transcriptional repressor) of toxin-antitoxin stability system